MNIINNPVAIPPRVHLTKTAGSLPLVPSLYLPPHRVNSLSRLQLTVSLLHEQKGWDRGRWGGFTRSMKRSMAVSVERPWLALGGPFLSSCAQTDLEKVFWPYRASMFGNEALSRSVLASFPGRVGGEKRPGNEARSV